MSQERYRYPRSSNYRRRSTGRFPTGRIRTIVPEPRRRIWPLLVLIALELLFLLALGALWLWPYLAMPDYVGPNVEVAQVQISITKIPHLMHAQVVLFDKDHKPSQVINCYIMQGNTLTLQFDTITFVPWEKSLGLHSGY